MASFVDSLRDPVLFAIPAFFAFIGLEILSLRLLDKHEAEQAKELRGYEKGDSRASLLAGTGSLFFTGATRAAALVGYAALYELTPLRIDPHRWWNWAMVIVLVDLLFYVNHRGAHRIRFFWAGHQAHHNSQYFNLTTALRQKWNPWLELIVWTPLPVLGVPPWMIFSAFSVNLLYQFWVHTETIDRLPRPVEFLFNTPSHHRVHHGSDPDYLDRNYGGILIVWDRMFGSYAEETHRPKYGLTKNIDAANPFRLQYHEYASMFRDVRTARRRRDKLGYLFGPPGWAPKQPAPSVEWALTD
jgi:sterol desaturase/sphingolipid hydroxylase (fatty acid hydroxylase superfamily)